MCDPEDALQHALTHALKYYVPDKYPNAFVNYILTLAFHYAWQQAYPSDVWRSTSLDEELEDSQGKPSSRCEYGFGIEDKRWEDTWINPDLVDAIKEKIWTVPGHKRLSRINAVQMLAGHVQTIETGDGIGYNVLDNYRQEQGKDPCRWKNQERYQFRHTPQHVLREMREQTCELYGMTHKHFYKAQCLLRRATREVVRAGGFSD
ncbi:MAG: hypothetical protein L0Y55_09430 [Anaerolineales bacterium]|nr:hypothetical protein [Anaerolineales bacterium]